MTKQEKYELRNSLGLNEDDYVLIEVGELNKNKNQIMAIYAMRELVKENSNVHLLIVGKGKLRSLYNEKIKEYKLEKNVHLLGLRDDVPNLMKISNILLSLSYREGLPVNVIEGMFCKLPVIATDCRGNRDLVQDGINGHIINLNNVAELVDKVNLIMHNENILESDMKKYSIEMIQKDMQQIYKDYLSK